MSPIVLGQQDLGARQRGRDFELKSARIALIATACAALGFATTALADPCKAIPDRGPMPPYLATGKAFSGPAVYIGDGDSLCVATGQGPSTWVEVRLADFYAPELSAPGGRQAKAALEQIAKGRRVECRTQHRSHDRVVAVCTLQGVSLGDRMRAAGVSPGGHGSS